MVASIIFYPPLVGYFLIALCASFLIVGFADSLVLIIRLHFFLFPESIEEKQEKECELQNFASVPNYNNKSLATEHNPMRARKPPSAPPIPLETEEKMKANEQNIRLKSKRFSMSSQLQLRQQIEDAIVIESQNQEQMQQEIEKDTKVYKPGEINCITWAECEDIENQCFYYIDVTTEFCFDEQYMHDSQEVSIFQLTLSSG